MNLLFNTAFCPPQHPNISSKQHQYHLPCSNRWLVYFQQLTNRGRHLSPLQHCLLGDAAVGVNVDAFVLIAHQQFHPTAVRKDYYGMRTDYALDLKHT